MRSFLYSLVLLFPVAALAQSSLPPCSSSQKMINCQLAVVNSRGEVGKYTELWVVIDEQRDAGQALVISPVDMELTTSSREQVQRLVREHRNSNVYRIFGTGFRSGSTEWNLALGQKAAEVVRHELVTTGVDALSIEAISFGKVLPDVKLAEERADPSDLTAGVAGGISNQKTPAAELSDESPDRNPFSIGYAGQIAQKIRESIIFPNLVPASAVEPPRV